MLNSDYSSIFSVVASLHPSDIKALLKPRKPNTYKGDYGHAVIVAGSKGKIGASVLCVGAALRSGCGLVSAVIPETGNDVLQATQPEAMTIPSGTDYVDDFLIPKKASAIGIGPGLGIHPNTAKALLKVFQTNLPCVIDADGLNLLSLHPHLLQNIPKGSVLTPHKGEFKRLVGSFESEEENLVALNQLAKNLNSVVVLKGNNTLIVYPQGELFINTTGNAGMAKGGSGDVLTGIVTSLLAQGYTAIEAAKIGVYIHGLAGNMAADKYTQHAMKAVDIINELPSAFKEVV